METNSRAHLSDKMGRTGTDALKAEVITGMPYEKFANIQNIYKLSAKNEALREQNQTVHDDKQETGRRRSKRTQGTEARTGRFVRWGKKRTSEMESGGPCCRNNQDQ